ncbi:MAG: UvrD-helicase domain-containing protein [Clostridiales bacterium]|nr:UvrD-helicase domain-containing protein [Clostridiales bacterium]
MRSEFLKLRRQIIEKDFSKMNDMQMKAVLSTEGPLLVLAGAGSGKTTVLVNRTANLLKYGSAYTSDRAYREPTDEDMALLRSFYDGEIDELPFETADLLSYGAPRPWEILAITFTNKAANELKERIVSKLGDEIDNIGDIWACTFHSACARLLRRFGDCLGYSSHFTIYDTDDSKRVIKECQRILGIDDKFLPHKTILREISRAKDMLVSPEEYAKTAAGEVRTRRIADAYECYQRLLKNADAMDFDDIIVNTVKLLETNAEVCDYCRNKFKYIMVDEYQDTNHAQYRLTSLLAEKHKNICVVGDDDQSIYKFRGATIENILSFENRYENVVTIRLEQNYRSTQNILDAANAVIANNEQRKGKNLWTANGMGEKIKVYTADDERDEGTYISDKIIALKAAGGKWSDNAVLYRMNAQSNSVENAFVRTSIPYRIIGGYRFYERKEIRDAIAYLTVIGNHSDNVRLRRIINEPKRGIGDATMNAAAQIAAGLGVSVFDVIKEAENYPSLSRAAGRLKDFTDMIERFTGYLDTMKLEEVLPKVLEESGYYASLLNDMEKYEDRMENLGELSSNIARYSEESEDPSLNGFLEDVALMTDIDSYNAESDSVVMMTVHSAKGLEFTNVFIDGMEENVFPGSQSLYSQEELEEERRLAYVAITRAKKRLYMTNARTRMMFGSTVHNPPSRFINEIPFELVDREGMTFGMRGGYSPFTQRGDLSSTRGTSKASPARTAASADNAKSPSAPLIKINIGDTVKHKAFGVGMVLSVKSMGNDALLEIAFEKVGTKKIMQKFAKLEKLS